MNIQIAKGILASIPTDRRNALEAAHWRYMCFTGITSIDQASDDQAVIDRTNYPHLLKFTIDGQASLSNDRCAEFMSLVSGMPREWCAAWDEYETSYA